MLTKDDVGSLRGYLYKWDILTDDDKVVLTGLLNRFFITFGDDPEVAAINKVMGPVLEYGNYRMVYSLLADLVEVSDKYWNDEIEMYIKPVSADGVCWVNI